MHKFLVVVAFVLLFVVFPYQISSAEVLQIKNSSTLVIGDNNRNYTVRIACLEVEPSDEIHAVNYIESILPRRAKVNLKPNGSKDGILISRIIKMGANIDIGAEVISKGLGSSSC